MSDSTESTTAAQKAVTRPGVRSAVAKRQFGASVASVAIANAANESKTVQILSLESGFYDQSQKSQALETLYSLNENFSNYGYWVGKSYLLIAEIFMSMGENFQAKATLESLLENTEINEIKNNAEELLSKIQDDE